MDRTVQQITQHFLERLPENSNYYRLDEFRSWDFPSFVVRRIKEEVKRNLSESMIIPQTDWADNQSEAVRNAWQQFIMAIRAEAYLPASSAQAVIETVVEDLLNILVQPRKNISNVIFGGDNELEYHQLHERLKSLGVYPHFGRLIVRYMQRKELDKLTKERCVAIIKNADQRLTRKYSPLNWAQLLEPLFTLCGGTLDSNLLRLFFEDKNRPRIARKFDLMDDTLTRAQFIEVLSSPDLLNLEGYETGQSALFTPGDNIGTDAANDSGDHKVSSLVTDESVLESSPEKLTDDNEPELQESGEDFSRDSKPSEFEEVRGQISEEEADVDTETDIQPDNSLNAAFASLKEEWNSHKFFDETESDEAESEKAEIKEESPEVHPLSKSQEEAADAITPSLEDPENRPEASAEEEETPMWMRFMNEEEIAGHQVELGESGDMSADVPGEENEIDQKDNNEDETSQEPVIDLSKSPKGEGQELLGALSDARDFFVREIFRGSERAYEEALEEISSRENWVQASKYIQNDIFKRNYVDMYSEAAVDFTDRLHGYFLEKENNN